MRSSNLLFAGAMAEALLESASEPVNVQLARAALQSATPAFSESDRLAICVVRSVPDDVARLLATDVASAEETEAAGSLDLVMTHCAQGSSRIQSTPAGLRAMLSTAALRQIRAVAPQEEARN
ncbi:MAG TPA: hypothetical protein VFO69_13365 [Allosphingosinicella sp.]|nr:hypothetical protein [Allosphingosinicella sp.]